MDSEFQADAVRGEADALRRGFEQRLEAVAACRLQVATAFDVMAVGGGKDELHAQHDVAQVVVLVHFYVARLLPVLGEEALVGSVQGVIVAV